MAPKLRKCGAQIRLESLVAALSIQPIELSQVVAAIELPPQTEDNTEVIRHSEYVNDHNIQRDYDIAIAYLMNRDPKRCVQINDRRSFDYFKDSINGQIGKINNGRRVKGIEYVELQVDVDNGQPSFRYTFTKNNISDFRSFYKAYYQALYTHVRGDNDQMTKILDIARTKVEKRMHEFGILRYI